MREAMKMTVSGAFGLVMVFVSATLAVVSVSEIASRDSFTAFLRQHGDGLRAEYFESTRNRAPSSKPAEGAIAKEKNLSDEIDAIRVFEQQVRMLGALGAPSAAQTLEGVRRRFEEYRNDRDNRASLERIEAELTDAEFQLSTAKTRLEAEDAQIGLANERAKAAREENETRRSDYSKLVKERDALRAELASIEARMKSFASRALNSEDKKELLTLQEKRDVAGAKYDSVLDQLKRFESIVVATSPPYDLPTKLQEQRANDAERVARLENTIATARKQREVYQIDNKIVVGSAFWPFPKLHSDYLLALSIMTCSALGALIVGLRGSNPTSLKDVTLGIASGFVCYFAIKGGKYVFLLTTHSELVSFNPYGSAFAGLLVGLFSERVYGLLSMLVGDLEKRLQLALASNDAAPRSAIHDGHTERMGGPALVANQPLPPPQARLG